MIRFKTLKELVEYAVETGFNGVGIQNTIQISIEQGWVRMSPKVRSELLKDSDLMVGYIERLVQKYNEIRSDNVIDLFKSRTKVNEEKTKDFLSMIQEKNKQTSDRLKEERNKNNSSVLRQYRIKK